MELFNNLYKAINCAVKRFVRQKSDDPVYVYRISIVRCVMWAVLSSAEAQENHISIKQCYTKVDGQYGLLEHKQRVKEQKPDKKTRLMMAAERGYWQFRKAQEKLEEMGRDAEGVKRAPEVCSDGSL